MAWQENKFEHAKLYVEALNKLTNYLGADKINEAQMDFQMQNFEILEKLPSNEEVLKKMFLTWMISEYQINGVKAFSWATAYKSFTAEEKEVLQSAAKKYIMGLFLVKEATKDNLTLIDPWGKEYFVEVCELEGLKENICIMAQIRPKNDNKWFLPGMIAPYENDAPFKHAQKIVQFDQSFEKILTGFEEYLIKEENLSKKTVSKHTGNAETFLFFLKEETKVTSFSEVTKRMIKTGFKKFLKKFITPIDYNQSLYSLYKFFSYLEDNKIQNNSAYEWLKKVI